VITATWTLAIATIVLAISGPVALFAWFNTRRTDRAQHKREESTQAEERMLERARKEFAPKSWGSGAAQAAFVVVCLVALGLWANRNQGGAGAQPGTWPDRDR
jgi:type II secretory pathway pseudopilin PulG